ncbi:MAG TPA: hypothetical protein VJ761_22115 [Ktedonobacteraceae bacterium]|nr:hypothetical protein [Ktedonobacteraceae bacterium]
MKKRNWSMKTQIIGKISLLALALLIVLFAGISIAAHSSSSPNTSTQKGSTSTQVSDPFPTAQVFNEAPLPGSVTVRVLLIDYKIISSVKVFHVGVPYHFVITNGSNDYHAFTFIPDKPDGTPLDKYTQYNDMLIGIDLIDPGTIDSVNYTFAPSTVGKYEIACQMRNHYLAGMRLPVSVVK